MATWAGASAGGSKISVNKQQVRNENLLLIIHHSNFSGYQSRRFVILTLVRLSNRCEPKLIGGRRILWVAPFASCTVTTMGLDGAGNETSPSRSARWRIDSAARVLNSETCDPGSAGAVDLLGRGGGVIERLTGATAITPSLFCRVC